MSSKKETILQLYARAPAPCRDYYGLTINTKDIILNIWNITHGPHVYPKRSKILIEELPTLKSTQEEIKRLFGEHVLEYVLKLSKHELNLQYLPSRIFHKILRCLAANDILKLSQTSKIYFELCNTNSVWQILYMKKIKRPFQGTISTELKSWKDILKHKLLKKSSSVVKNIAAGRVKVNNNTIKRTQSINKMAHKPVTNKNEIRTKFQPTKINTQPKCVIKHLETIKTKTINPTCTEKHNQYPTKINNMKPPKYEVNKTLQNPTDMIKSQSSMILQAKLMNNLKMAADYDKFMEAKSAAEKLLDSTLSDAIKSVMPKLEKTHSVKSTSKQEETRNKVNNYLQPTTASSSKDKISSTKSFASILPNRNKSSYITLTNKDITSKSQIFSTERDFVRNQKKGNFANNIRSGLNVSSTTNILKSSKFKERIIEKVPHKQFPTSKA